MTTYLGQENKGVDVIKLGNPEIKFVYESPEGVFHEVTKICPYGIKTGDNPENYPNEIYVMGIFPGGIASNVSADYGDDKTDYCDLWSLNSANAPIIPWDSKVKTYIKKLPLKRQSDTPTDELYNVFRSGAIRVTIAPDKGFMPDPQEPPPNELPSIDILSGDYRKKKRCQAKFIFWSW